MQSPATSSISSSATFPIFLYAAESLSTAAEKLEAMPIRMWTDDFTDLYQILK